MNFTDRFAQLFKTLLPSPFTIAILLTLFTYIIALVFTDNSTSDENYAYTLLTFWENGLWKSGLLVFAMQMMLMLVLGHVLALSPVFDKLIQSIVQYCNTTSKAALIVTLFTLIVAWFNWGLGLIFGAIFARKVAEYAIQNGIKINYPLVGAAGYSGLMIWHGGFSGSSLIKVAEEGHLKKMMNNTLSPEVIAQLPNSIGFDQTIFSIMNIVATILVMIIVPLSLFWLGKRLTPTPIQLKSQFEVHQNSSLVGAEKIDHSNYFGSLIGALLLLYCLYKLYLTGIRFFIPNNINLLLLALGLFFHRSFSQFLKGIDAAISGASGILIQFPLYFGIMGIMNSSGLVEELSGFFVSISNENTYPIFTFFSAGLVNIFVPSGGGQWAVQGPIIVSAATDMGIPLAKNIMAMAYGDQLTNMLQPFWALPLLGITGLKAKEILPYTLFIMIVSGILFLGVLTIF